MGKHIILLLLLIAFQFKLIADKNLDSLEKVIYKSADNIAKVDALIKLSWELEYNETERALKTVESAYELAKKLNYKKGQAQSLNDMGICYSFLGKVQKSMSSYFQSLKIKEELKDDRGIGISMINIGQIYRDQGQDDKAFDYYFKALVQFQKINNEIEIGATYNSIGALFSKEGKLDTAKVYLEKAVLLLAKHNDEDGVAECYNNLAIVYKHKGDMHKAIKYYELVKRHDEKRKSKFDASITLNNLSGLYADLNQLDKAISTAEESAKISNENGFLQNLKYSYKNLANYYKTKKNYPKAFEYQSAFFNVCDTLKNRDLALTLNDLSVKYETDKKDQQNKLLQTQNDLSEKTIKQQKLITYFIIIGFCLVTLLAFFIFRGLKKQRKANAIISEQKLVVEQQKQLVEEKHKEITDSINYAERIQRSFLATKQLLDDNLKNYFVFFQPKDIVSGDFYWASRLSNGNFAIVTADSTGHGVPGAIMSILNISCLENAVKEGQVEPSNILDHTRINIIERLKKDGSKDGGKDGMDASLISINFENLSLTYAAANNPVLIVRKNTILELSSDKMPIGKHDKDSIPFSQHAIQLEKNDMVYTLTDGMPDQFGGPRGKKFLYKQLKELLIGISELPMEDQKETVKATMNKWKGNLEQVDDVCIIGMRL